jgi:hypothetical protein
MVPSTEGEQHRQAHRLGRHPVAFGIINSGEGIPVSLLLAKVSPHRLGVAVAGEGAVGSRSVGKAIHPIAATALR